MRNLSIEEKKVFGKTLNEVTTKLNNAIEEKRSVLEAIELNNKLESESIDISLPATKVNLGTPNIWKELLRKLKNY